MSKKSNGRVWPYIIGLSITLVFGFCVATIFVTSRADVQESDAYIPIIKMQMHEQMILLKRV